MLVLASSPIVFGYTKYNPTLEDQLGNSTKTKLVHDGAILILNQTIQKLVYKVGENITISTELINIGNKAVDIAYGEPWVALEIKNQNGDEIWPNSGIASYPEFQGKKTLKPGEHISEQPWGLTSAPNIFPNTIRLSSPGNFTAISVAIFRFTTPLENSDSVVPLWSKPLQITILPEEYIQNETNSSMVKIPEFPVTIPILAISLIFLLVFYRMKSSFKI